MKSKLKDKITCGVSYDGERSESARWSDIFKVKNKRTKLVY